jgi:hypothetical protein
MNGLSYDLAKELKDAGYPQKLDVHKAAMGDAGFDVEETPTFPTLSGLIDECRKAGDDGKPIAVTLYSPDIWGKWQAIALRGREVIRGKGESAHEVMARLWLALNEK